MLLAMLEFHIHHVIQKLNEHFGILSELLRCQLFRLVWHFRAYCQ